MPLRMLAAASLLPFLAGCGTWSHPSKPLSALGRDKAMCELAAIEKVQVNAQKQDAPPWMAKSLGKSYTTDANEMLRYRWQDSCLRYLGWTFGPAPQQPGVAATELAGEDAADTAAAEKPPATARRAGHRPLAALQARR